MGTVMDEKGTKAFCDEVYTELAGMKKKIAELRDKARSQNVKSEIITVFERHLNEIVDQIDWKFQILAHVCPYEWKGSADFENPVQVDESDKSPDSDTFSGGYLGG